MSYVIAAYTMVIGTLLVYGLHLGASRARLMGRSGALHRLTAWVVFGFVLGGLLGILLRPSVPVVGQLSLEAVFSRGESLRGLDAVLAGEARKAFNVILASSIVGAALAGFAGVFLGRERARRSG